MFRLVFRHGVGTHSMRYIGGLGPFDLRAERIAKGHFPMNELQSVPHVFLGERVIINLKCCLKVSKVKVFILLHKFILPL